MTLKSAEEKTAQGYAGDVDADRAWSILNDDPAAVMVDVRTRAEWNFVGLPDLDGVGRPLLLVEWQGFPGGERNAGFVDELSAQLKEAGAGADAPVLFLCRSGQRSLAAAQAMTAAGYSACFNVAGGFEGPLDDKGHRGGKGGWKAAGLPWRQS